MQNKPAFSPAVGDGNEICYYPTPLPLSSASRTSPPSPTSDIPAVLSYIFRARPYSGNSSEDMVYLYIGRDRSVSLRSFTISYRFSALPIMIEDPARSFHRYEYTDEDINDHDYIVCKLRLPASLSADFPGCSAYVSKICLTDGTEIAFSSSDFFYAEQDEAYLDNALDRASQKVDHIPASAQSVSKAGASNPLSYEDTVSRRHTRKSRLPRYIGYGLSVIGIGVLIFFGVEYFSYQHAMLGAEVYLDAGEIAQAEAYVQKEIGRNRFLLTQENALSGNIRILCAEKRYNEAYKILSQTPFASLLQEVCRRAADDALQGGDYQTAFVYAKSAPTPFDDEITSKAVDLVIDTESNQINEEMYLIAQQTSTPEVLDRLLSRIIEYAKENDLYHTAMRAALKSSTPEAAAAAAADVFSAATQYYIDNGDYNGAATFISAYNNGEHAVEEHIEDALIAHFSKTRDTESAFFLAKHFGISAADIQIEAEDLSIRSDLSGLYSLLSPEQKRDYHAHRITVGGLFLTIGEDGILYLHTKTTGASPTGGSVTDTLQADAQRQIRAMLEGKTPIVSVASNDLNTVVLHEDGTLTAFANRMIGNAATAASAEELSVITAAQSVQGVVAIAAGDAHFVFLHEDGSVSAIGDNTYTQCSTTSSDWHDITAIAAGGYFTLGLRADGTVVAVGDDSCGQCQVSGLHHVVSIAAADLSTAVLFADGTVTLRGDRGMGMTEVPKLTDVKRIRAGGSALIAEHNDGSFTLCGGCVDTGNYGSVASWSDIADYEIGDVCAAAIHQNGSIRTTGTNRVQLS